MIAGLGPGPVDLLTVEARKVLDEAQRVFFRYGTHPVAKMLILAGKDVVSFERLYADPAFTYGDVYKLIVKAVIKEAKLEGRAVLALPGNPYVFEKTPRWIEEAASDEGDIEVKIVAGMSFLELLYPLLGVDPEEGLVILNAARVIEEPDRCIPSGGLHCIIGQLGLPVGPKPTGEQINLEPLVEALLHTYPHDHCAVLVRCRGYPDYVTDKLDTTVGSLTDNSRNVNNLTTLYLPPFPVDAQRVE